MMFVEGYKISDLVSQDVIGKTFLATHPESAANVLIKMLHENFANDADLVKIFHACAETASSLSDDRFTNLLSYGKENDCAYTLFEVFDLPALSTSLGKSHILPVIDATNLIEKLATALQVCHDRGMIHGVLSPSDIFYDSRSQKLKIGNPGFARFYKELIARRDETVTEDLHYFAPELVLPHGELTAQSDVFSLGCLFYRFVVGSKPWSDTIIADLLNGKPRTSLVPPSLQRLEVPDILDRVITTATELEIGSRQRSLQQFLSEVVKSRNEILASLTPTSALIYERLEREIESPDHAPELSEGVNSSEVGDAGLIDVEKSGPDDKAGTPDESAANGVEEQVKPADRVWEIPFAAESRDQTAEPEVATEPLADIPELEPDLHSEAKSDDVVQSEAFLTDSVTPPFPSFESVPANGESENDTQPADDTDEPESEMSATLPEDSLQSKAEERVVDETESPVISSPPPEIWTDKQDMDPPQPVAAVPATPSEDEQTPVANDSHGEAERKSESLLKVESEQLSLPDISDFMGSFTPRSSETSRPFPSIQSHLFDDRTLDLMPRRQKLNGTANNGAAENGSSAMPSENQGKAPQAEHNSEYVVNLSKPAKKVKRKGQKPRRQEVRQVRDNSIDPVVNLKTTHTITIRRKPWFVLQQFPPLVWRIAPVVAVGLFVFIAIALGLPDRVRNSAFVRNLTSDSQAQRAPWLQGAQRQPPKMSATRKGQEQSANQLDVGSAPGIRNPDQVRGNPVNSETVPQVAQRTVTKTQRRAAAAAASNAQQATQLRLNVQVRSFGTPQIAEVFVDGALYGRTNRQGALLISSLKKARPYLLKVKKNGYQLWAKEVFFPRLGQQTIEVNLEAMQQASKQPSAMPSSEVNTATEKPASAGRRQAAERSPGTKKATDSKPAQQTGFGTVNVLLSNTESFADAYIYVNGRRWNGSGYVAPAKLELPPGSYVIAVRKKGYVAAPPSYALDIVDGETKSLTFILTAE